MVYYMYKCDNKYKYKWKRSHNPVFFLKSKSDGTIAFCKKVEIKMFGKN